MGHSARAENILLCVSALEAILSEMEAPINRGVALAEVQKSLSAEN
jgi:alanine-glyoxylate transaminase/serine-glyoxylate transaminase/serine-pyruvate transaminase